MQHHAPDGVSAWSGLPSDRIQFDIAHFVAPFSGAVDEGGGENSDFGLKSGHRTEVEMFDHGESIDAV
jgi:hypothetical protein